MSFSAVLKSRRSRSFLVGKNIARINRRKPLGLQTLWSLQFRPLQIVYLALKFIFAQWLQQSKNYLPSEGREGLVYGAITKFHAVNYMCDSTFSFEESAVSLSWPELSGFCEGEWEEYSQDYPWPL